MTQRDRIALVGCSSSKYDPDEWGKAHPDYEEGDEVDVLPLRHLYRWSYWIVKHRYARVVADNWRVVSAGLGLAHPDRPMTSSYDKSLKNMTDAEIDAWVDEIEPDLRAFARSYANEDVVLDVLLGGPYREALEPIIADLPVPAAYPFAGTSGNGEQMERLNELVDEYREHGTVTLEEGAATLPEDDDDPDEPVATDGGRHQVTLEDALSQGGPDGSRSFKRGDEQSISREAHSNGGI